MVALNKRGFSVVRLAELDSRALCMLSFGQWTSEYLLFHAH